VVWYLQAAQVTQRTTAAGDDSLVKTCQTANFDGADIWKFERTGCRAFFLLICRR
jgi:hypothetical protein